jgi:sarcosine oxidase, subunit beta
MPPKKVVIIGAGITGALLAHRLLEQGVGVTILEAREKGAGSSSRSAACSRQQFSTPATVRAMIYSTRFYERFEEAFLCEPGQGHVLVQNGYLFLHGESEPERWANAQAQVAMQRANGLHDVQMLTPSDVADRFPHATADGLLGATFCPTDGFLHPDVVYMEGFRRVEELGGELRQNAQVVSGTAQNGRLVEVQTAAGESFTGDVFVNATNAWAPRVSEALGGSDLPISPVKRYLYFLERGDQLDDKTLMTWPMTITPSRAYCRPENANQLLAGWAHPAEPEPQFDWNDQDLIDPSFFHKAGLDNYGFQLWMQLAEALPITGQFKGIQATTAGFYAVTPDHNPLLGFDPKVRGLLHAVGFSGHGAMMGPFTAAAIAAMAIAGEDLLTVDLDGVEVDVSPLRIDREFGKGEGMVI